MGRIIKSILILLVAASFPIAYRNYANENTIKFMSSYYSNYKSIDHFIRNSGQAIDKLLFSALDEIKTPLVSINELLNKNVKTSKEDSPHREAKQKDVPKSKVKYVDCPGENYSGEKLRLFDKKELALHDGSVENKEIMLSFLGHVYNVNANYQHYAIGGDYHAFAGRDATRAFVTGNFTHDLNDYIIDIEESAYSHFETWQSFYKSNYPIVGRLEGAFYDSRGCPTVELKRVNLILQKLTDEKNKDDVQHKAIPECNSEWNADLKEGRVWCTTKSGGIERDWVGVPRLYDNGRNQRCGCFNIEAPGGAEIAKSTAVYPGCDPNATECVTKQ